MRAIEVTLKDSPEVRRVVLAANPNYRKHKAMLMVGTSITLSGTAWDGGSRSQYYAVDLATGRCSGSPRYDPPQFGGPKVAPTCAIPEGVVIVELGTFLGKPATAFVTLHPNNAAKLLPNEAPKPA